MLTLWDLMPGKGRSSAGGSGKRRPKKRGEAPAAPRGAKTKKRPLAPVRDRQRASRQGPRPADRARRSAAAPVDGDRITMRERYELVTREMLAKHGVRVRKWRTSMSGVAWQITYTDGSVAKLIEAPRPRGPMSAAVFLHEIGHHVIGFGTYKPRCLEEYHAWAFALSQMRELGLNVTPAVERRMRLSLEYAVAKARRRGLRVLPEELAEYLAQPRPAGASRRRPRRRAA